MSGRCLLYLTAESLRAYRWQSGRLTEEAGFDTAGDGFPEYLRVRSRSRFTLLINVAEESFQIDRLPRLSARDRRAMLARRLAQRFAGAPLTAAIRLGREAAERRNEKILLAALTDGDFLRPWLSALQAARAQLTGIYTPPLIGALLLEARAAAPTCDLLLTVQDTTLRQTFFVAGRLHFSRLTPLGDGSLADLAASETDRTRQYLLGQRLLDRGEVLVVDVFAHPQTMPTLAQRCRDSESLRYRFHDLCARAHELGLATPVPDDRAELLYLHAMAGKAPREQFADAPLRRDYRLARIASALRLGGTGVFAGCAAFAAAAFVDLRTLEADIASTRLAARQTDERLQAAAGALPSLPVGTEALRRLTDRHDELSGLSGGPDELWREIADALKRTPQIEIIAIDWKLEGALEQSPPGRGGQASARLRGTLDTGGDASPRQLQAAFDAFVAQLRSTPGLSVVVDRPLLDLSSTGTLRRSDWIGEENSGRPFQLTVSRRSGA